MSPTSLPTRRYTAKLIQHRIAVYLLDWAAFALSGLLAFELRFDGALPARYFHPMEVALCIWVVAKSVAFVVGKLDRGNWRYTSTDDAVRGVAANSAGSILGVLVIFLLLGPWGIPRSVYILDWLLSCLLTLGGGWPFAWPSQRRAGVESRVSGPGHSYTAPAPQDWRCCGSCGRTNP